MTKTMFRGIGNVIKIVIKLVLVVLLIAMSYVKLDKLFDVLPEGADDAGLLHALPENSLDIIVIGSSHAQYSFIPSFIHNDLGLYSYVLGSPCQPMEVSVEMLKEVYKRQNPKLVIFEVYRAMPLSDSCAGDSCYVTASYQVTGEERKNVLSYLPEEKAKEYINKFTINHNNWRTIQSINDLHTKDQVFDETGTYSFGYIDIYPKLPVKNYWNPSRYDYDVDIELREKDAKALDEILRLCKEHGSELLLYKTPVDGLSVEDQSIRHKIWNWADANNVKYIDLVDISDKLGYYMQIHTNSGHAYLNGAAIITNYFSDFIKNNYIDIFDHKQNDMLDTMYKARYFEFFHYSSDYEYNPMVYLNRIFKNKGTIILRYNKYVDRIDQSLVDKLVSLGVKEGFNNDSYYAIYKDGKLLRDSTDAFSMEVDGHWIDVGTDKVFVDGSEVKPWTGSPMSITVYNENMSEHITKEIDTRKVWEFGYNSYNE